MFILKVIFRFATRKEKKEKRFYFYERRSTVRYLRPIWTKQYEWKSGSWRQEISQPRNFYLNLLNKSIFFVTTMFKKKKCCCDIFLLLLVLLMSLKLYKSNFLSHPKKDWKPGLTFYLQFFGAEKHVQNFNS